MKSNRKKNKKWKILFVVLVSLISIFLVVGVAIFKHYYNLLDVQIEEQVGELTPEEEFLENEYNTEDKQSIEEKKVDEKAFNIMLVGVDSYNSDFKGRTDSMILFSINPETKKVVMTSFLRDMYVKIPGYGENRLNAAYTFGGTELLGKTIFENFGIEVTDFVVVNFKLVMDLVDVFGGVEVDVTTEEIEVMNQYVTGHNRWLGNPDGTDLLAMSDNGKRVLNGNQALGYARIRYVGTDFGRTSRQREIVSALIEKMKVMSIKEMDYLLEQFLPKVRTSLSEKDLTTLLFMALGIKDYTIESMAIPVDNTWEYSTINGMSVIEVDCKANGQAWYDIITKE